MVLTVFAFMACNLIGIMLGSAEVKTMCFFLLFETLVLITVWFTAFVVSYINEIRSYLYNSFSHLILGAHIAAGMLVLGVYFTL
jgi:hypothetical protein